MCFACWCGRGRTGCRRGRWRRSSKLAPNTLTFHFDRLRDAGLVTVRRDGRSMIYATRFETMNALVQFLTENCCQGSQTGRAAECAPVAACVPAPASKGGGGGGFGERGKGAAQGERGMRLYLFEHCSLCFRVRMTAALKRRHLQESVVRDDDSRP